MRRPIIEDLSDVPLRELVEANIEIVQIWPRVEGIVGWIERPEVWR